MVVIGLTGSIGMGKSTAAAMLRRDGLPVHDADAVVHRALARDGAAVPTVEREFPGVVTNGIVDRRRLGSQVFNDPEALRRLERVLHPIVHRSSQAFLRRAGLDRRRCVVLDVPLLFESGGDGRVDRVFVVSAPAFLQRQRVLSRPGMTPEILEAVRRQQLPDQLKRRLADVVIPTGLGRAVTRRALRRAVRRARSCPRRHWPPNLFLEGRRARDCARYRNNRA